jgi:hypothetical protein
MHEKAAFVFWTTLGLYILTLFTVSYVGVYLTYVAIPIIVLSGLAMLISKPKKQTLDGIRKVKGAAKSTLEEAKEAFGVEDFKAWLDEKSKENEARSAAKTNAEKEENMKLAIEVEAIMKKIEKHKVQK